MRILCVGLATVDLIYSVAAIPGVDEKAQATGLTIAAGGPAANAAVTAAALGAEVTLVTPIGRHSLGDLVRADLAAHGVHIVDADPDNPAPPPVSAVTVLESTGERTIVSRNAGDLTARVPDSGLPDADLTLVDGHHPALAVAAARSARRLLVDAGSWRPVFAEIFPLAEVVACSAAFRPPSARLTSDAVSPGPLAQARLSPRDAAAELALPQAATVLPSPDPAAGPSSPAPAAGPNPPIAAAEPSRPDAEARPSPPGGAVQPSRPDGSDQPPRLDGSDQPSRLDGADQPSRLDGADQPSRLDGPAEPSRPRAVAELFARDAVVAAAIGAPHVAVTHGPGPVSWFAGDRSGTIDVPGVAAVDTAGAGDAFHGAPRSP